MSNDTATDESDENDVLAEFRQMQAEREQEIQSRITEMDGVDSPIPASAAQYRDRFADGLPTDYEPVVAEFHDPRLQLSHWFPKLRNVDVPLIETHIFELEEGEGEEMLDEVDADVDENDIIMSEEPLVVFAYFGLPELDEIAAAVEDMNAETVFLRGDYKSSPNLGFSANFIEDTSAEHIATTVMHQFQDQLMMGKPLGSALVVREYLDLDFCPDERPTLHPEVRFFIEDGEVLYHFPRLDKETFANVSDGVAHYERATDAINEHIDQLYEWAGRVAREFDEASWSLDFVMDTDGNWVATDMALNGLYFSERKDRWHNISNHESDNPFNLEEQFGDSFPHPDDIDGAVVDELGR